MQNFSRKHTVEDLMRKVQSDDDCAVNALICLVADDEEAKEDGLWVIEESHAGFLKSLWSQAVWRRREHEQGVNLCRPVLTESQLRVLRNLLKHYRYALYQIALERVGELKDEEDDEEPICCSCAGWADAYRDDKWFCWDCLQELDDDERYDLKKICGGVNP